MTEIMLMRGPGGSLFPVDEQSKATVGKWRLGEGVRAKVSRARNLQFHRKFFALLNLAFETWEPAPTDWRGQPAAKNFERFRKDLMALAGYAEPVVNLRGEVRMEAKSIAFANMDEDEFALVYGKVADVILQRVLTTYTRADLDRVVEEMMGFI